MFSICFLEARGCGSVATFSTLNMLLCDDSFGGLEVQILDKLNVSFKSFPEERYLYKFDK